MYESNSSQTYSSSSQGSGTGQNGTLPPCRNAGNGPTCNGGCQGWCMGRKY